MKHDKEDCFWVGTSMGGRRPEINLQRTDTDGKTDDQVVCCGYVPVVLSKVWGPLIFTDIRIRADYETNTWIVERRNEETGDWVEVIKIPGQNG